MRKPAFLRTAVGWSGTRFRRARIRWHGPGRFQTLRLWLAFGGWRDLWVFALTALVLFSIIQIEKEGRERRDQSCRIDERKQRADVQKLVQTYDFLTKLTPEQLNEARSGHGDLLNRAAVANLAQTEREALEDDAAPFCDEEGVGLPEPDTRIPARPDVLKTPPPPAPEPKHP